MTENDYAKLNDYLNGCFKEIEKKDSLLLDNLNYFICLSEVYMRMIKKYDLKKENKKNPELTFEDVYLLAREVIENINPRYLESYDTLIQKGILDFSYNNEYNDSHYYYHAKHGVELINIKREFNYNDVSTLVHEFMHKLNFQQSRMAVNRYLLTEFISIYFEEYARNCLLEKGISKEELDFNERIIATRRAASNFNWYSLILFVYKNIGPLDENSYQFINESGIVILTKEAFENECKQCLKQAEKIEKAYRMEVMFEKPYDESELYQRLADILASSYRYIFGAVFAFYALKNGDKDKMVYLNDHINDNAYADMTVNQILKTVGIDLTNVKIRDFIDIVEEQINAGNKVK